MSGGVGGGPGSQIFSIGKSKAKLFDENSDIKITFKATRLHYTYQVNPLYPNLQEKIKLKNAMKQPSDQLGTVSF